MAQVVPLNWAGSFVNWGGPLASGDTHHWWAAGGAWGRENRFYLFSAFADGSVEADVEVTHVSHYRRLDNGNLVDETHFDGFGRTCLLLLLHGLVGPDQRLRGVNTHEGAD